MRSSWVVCSAGPVGDRGPPNWPEAMSSSWDGGRDTSRTASAPGPVTPPAEPELSEPIAEETPPPAAEATSAGGATTEVNVNVGNLMGDDASLSSLARRVKEVLARENRRTSFPGINRLEYFPGSSAP